MGSHSWAEEEGAGSPRSASPAGPRGRHRQRWPSRGGEQPPCCTLRTSQSISREQAKAGKQPPGLCWERGACQQRSALHSRQVARLDVTSLEVSNPRGSRGKFPGTHQRLSMAKGQFSRWGG